MSKKSILKRDYVPNVYELMTWLQETDNFTGLVEAVMMLPEQCNSCEQGAWYAHRWLLQKREQDRLTESGACLLAILGSMLLDAQDYSQESVLTPSMTVSAYVIGSGVYCSIMDKLGLMGPHTEQLRDMAEHLGQLLGEIEIKYEEGGKK